MITWPGRFIAFMEIRFAVFSVSCKVEMLNQSYVGKQPHLGGMRASSGLQDHVKGRRDVLLMQVQRSSPHPTLLVSHLTNPRDALSLREAPSLGDSSWGASGGLLNEAASRQHRPSPCWAATWACLLPGPASHDPSKRHQFRSPRVWVNQLFSHCWGGSNPERKTN